MLKSLAFGCLAVMAALVIVWAVSLPTATFRLSVPGKGTIAYACTQTSTLAEARSRAEAAHQKFQSDLDAVATHLAPRILAAMEKATATGDRSDLEAANAEYLAISKQFRADLLSAYSCRVDTTLQAAP